MRTSVTQRLLIASLTTTMVAQSALGMQPCPPGTTPWSPWAIAGVALYLFVALVGIGALARAALRAKSTRKKLTYGAAALIALTLAAVGGLLLAMRISWIGTCV